MQISPDGIRLIKNFEGVCYTAYKDKAGIWTIGYRHTDGVSANMSITPDEAEDYLMADLAEIEQYINAYVSVPLTQHQFDALVAFGYDVGCQDILRRSDLLAFLNAGQYNRAADTLLEYNHDDSALVGRRREAERLLFLTPDETPGWWRLFTAWLHP